MFLACLGLAGCGRCGLLADAPVVGGSDEVHAAIRESLAAFAADAGEVCVPEVIVEPLDRPASIDRRSQRIHVDSRLQPEDLPLLLRHELCHAWDFERGLSEDGPAWLEDLALEMFADPDLELVDADYTTDRLERSEALAMFCGQAPPLAAATLALACDAEPAHAQQVHELLRDEVWVGTSIDTVAHGDPTFEVRDLGPEPTRLIARPIAGQLIGLHADYPDGSKDFVTLDLSSGEAAFVDAPAPGEWGWSPTDSPARPRELAGVVEVGAAGSEAAALVHADLLHLGTSRGRVIWAEDEVWSVVDQPCDLTLQTFVLVEGRAWTAWSSGPGVVSVRPVAH